MSEGEFSTDDEIAGQIRLNVIINAGALPKHFRAAQGRVIIVAPETTPLRALIKGLFKGQNHKFVAFKDTRGVILNAQLSLKKNLVKDGDTLEVCTSFQESDECVDCAFFFSLFCVIAVVVMSVIFIIKGIRVDVADNVQVVIDAGSVHSTIDVFRSGTENVRQVYSCETSGNVGISSFKNRPEGVAAYLVNSPCFEAAEKFLKPNSSSIFLGATAGMRVLAASEPKAAEDVMRAADAALNAAVANVSAEANILSGDDEGLYGWISANYLSGALATRRTLGALDWGGASAQITFAVDSDKSATTSVNLFGVNQTLFVASHLCYGQQEALKRYLVNLAFDFKGQNVIESPCHAKHLNFSVTFDWLFDGPCTELRRFDKAFKKTFRYSGSSDLKGCEGRINDLFNPKKCLQRFKGRNCFDESTIPTPKASTDFLAFSTYWYLTSALGLIGEKAVLNETTFENVVETLCKSNFAYAKDLLGAFGDEASRDSCFKGLFMRKLLKDGYKLNEWNKISFVKRVSDAEVSWTLGYALLKSSSSSLKDEDSDGLIDLLVIGEIFSTLFFTVMGIYYAVRFCFRVIDKRGYRHHLKLLYDSDDEK